MHNKPLVILFVLVALFLVYIETADAQDNYVLCESLKTGIQQVFKDACPSGWVFIDVA